MSGIEACICAVIAAWLLLRQVIPRRIPTGFPFGLVILAVLSAAALAFGVASVVKAHPVSAGSWILTGCLAPIAVALAAVRVRTLRIFSDDQGVAMRRGTIATVLIWIASITIHFLFGLGIDALDHGGFLGASTLYAYVTITLAAQRWFLDRRAGATPALPGTPTRIIATSVRRSAPGRRPEG